MRSSSFIQFSVCLAWFCFNLNSGYSQAPKLKPTATLTLKDFEWPHRVAFNSDNRLLFASNSKQEIAVWDLETKKHLRTFSAYKNDGNIGISDMAISPNGKFLVTVMKQEKAVFWEIGSFKKSIEFEIKSVPPLELEGADCCAFNANGGLFATGGWGTVTIWDVGNKKILRSFEAADSVDSIAFSPDGTFLATAFFGGKTGVILWDMKTGKKTQTISRSSGLWISMAFSPDSKRLLVGWNCQDDLDADIWDLGTGKILHSLKGHRDFIRSVAFAKDGKTVATGDWGSVRLWDADSARLLGLHVVPGKNGIGDKVGPVVFSSDGKTLAASCGSGVLLFEVPKR